MSDQRESRRMLRKRGHFAVRYEDLVLQTEATIRKLSSQLGLDYEPATVEHVPNDESMIFREESWKERNYEKLELRYLAEDRLTEAELDWLLRRLPR